MDQWSKTTSQYGELRSYRGSRLVRNSSSGSSSTSKTLSRQESHSSSSSSPTVGEIQVREREDATNSDISPVPVSNLVDDGSGLQANKIPKTNKKETTIERGKPLDSEIREWLQEFKENLVDDEIPITRRLSRFFRADYKET